MPKAGSSLVEIRPWAAPPDVNLAEWLAFTQSHGPGVLQPEEQDPWRHLLAEEEDLGAVQEVPRRRGTPRRQRRCSSDLVALGGGRRAVTTETSATVTAMTTTTEQPVSTRKSSQAKITGALHWSPRSSPARGRPSCPTTSLCVCSGCSLSEGYGFSSPSPCSLRIIAC
ncbi:hypothetical protein ABZP36_000840 [Zizania latifolia]